MKPWRAGRLALESRLQRCDLALFLDYDGTLVPLQPHPDKAVMPAATRALLKELAAIPSMRTAIVSGRPLQSIRRQTRIPAFFYAGNHGFEIQGPGMQFLHPAAHQAKKILPKLVPELKRALRHFPGAWIENKKVTLSLHYRALNSSTARNFSAWLHAWMTTQHLGRHFTLHPGKKVWEIRPRVYWNKGRAMLKILSHWQRRAGRPFLAVYIGDDRTDEDALKLLPPSGWGIKVTASGKGPSAARLYLKNPTETLRCLRWFKNLKK